MDTKSCSVIAVNCKSRADEYVKLKNFGRAFAHYLIALKLDPTWKTVLKEIFSMVLSEWSTVLEKNARHNELFKCYEQAIEIFPENELILNNLGAHLLNYGLMKEATYYFRKSIDIQPHFLRALRNLENVSNLIVPRWHFRMLNDSRRNGAFREAIRKKVSEGYDSVLDIGTGTGILSLFALEAGAKKVVACDSSSFMIDLANKVITDNNGECIKLINKHSSDLKIPDDVPERVGLVVTEIIDSGLFGEHILQTLVDAWDHLLLPPNTDPVTESALAAVIPFGATVFISGIECDSICKKYFLLNHVDSYIDFGSCVIVRHEEYYDSEFLKGIRNGFKFLTDVKKTFFINFNDPELLKKILDGEHEEILVLKCSRTGRLDCIAVWFDLFVDKDIVLSTAPDSVSSDSWDQAIFPMSNNIHICKGEEINVKFSVRDGKLSFSDFVFRSNEYPNTFLSNDRNVFNPSVELLQLLNSVTYTSSLLEVIPIIQNKFKRPISILDTFPFPFFGINYLLQSEIKETVLTSVVRNDEDRRLINFLAKKYDVQNQVHLLRMDEISDLKDMKYFDVILLDVIEQTGEVRDEIVPQLDYYNDNARISSRKLIMKNLVRLVTSNWI